MKQAKVGRNDTCPCGSGKKYKICCGRTGTDNKNSASRWVFLLVAGLLLLGTVGFLRSLATSEPAATPTGVWSPEHGHYH